MARGEREGQDPPLRGLALLLGRFGIEIRHLKSSRRLCRFGIGSSVSASTSGYLSMARLVTFFGLGGAAFDRGGRRGASGS